MSPLYERKGGLPRPLPGGVPRAFFRWEGNVTRADLDAVPFSLRGPTCGHCTNFASYKARRAADLHPAGEMQCLRAPCAAHDCLLTATVCFPLADHQRLAVPRAREEPVPRHGHPPRGAQPAGCRKDAVFGIPGAWRAVPHLGPP